MKLTTRGRRKAVTTLFPGNYFVFRNLALQIPDDGLNYVPVPNRLSNRILERLIPYVRREVQDNPEWSQFVGIDEDSLELVEPMRITGNVSPVSWWCTNPECNKFHYGNLRTIGAENSRCPNCRQRRLVQFAFIFICPTCHAVESVQAPPCPECNDTRSVILRGSGGRMLEYRWRCTRHPNFERFVGKNCRRDSDRMVLKSVGGQIYHPERWSHVETTPFDIQPQERNILRFSPSRATVIDVTLGRRPVANSRAFFQGNEIPPNEPFINPITNNYVGLVSRIDTDAIIISSEVRLDEITLHSLEHALLNAAPAVTGLVQDEFGSHIDYESNQIVIYDNVYGGSGGCRLLVDRRLDRWLDIVRELAECHQKQCDEACRGCLFLPSRLCRKINYDLNRQTVLNLFR